MDPQNVPAPARRMILMRHGPSAHLQVGWINWEGFLQWREAYEAAGILEGVQVPPELQTFLQSLRESGGIIVCSDARRAVETARLVAGDREVLISPLLRELDLESPRLPGLRLPLLAWAFAVGGRILVQSLRRNYPSVAESTRIRQAAEWLNELAQEHPLVVAITHASFRTRLAGQLHQTGWNYEPARRTGRPWSAWGLRRS